MTRQELIDKGWVEEGGVFVKRVNGVKLPVEFHTCFESPPPKSSRRIKQSTKPKLNKLEQEWEECLSRLDAYNCTFHTQSITFVLANGVRYTPDFFSFEWPHKGESESPTAWEVKGKHAWDDAIVKLKVAARQYPQVKWLLVWKENGEWKTQHIIP